MSIYDKKYIVVTHNNLYGPADALKDYLNNFKTKEVVFITHPLDGFSGDSTLTIFRDGHEISTIKAKRTRSILLFNFFLDIIYTVYWLFRYHLVCDVFIGTDNLNALSGLFLRSLRRTDKVIFYAIDFSPVRFENRILNYIYHFIEKICVFYSDETWNASLRISLGRKQYLGIDPDKHNQKTVFIGAWNNKIKRLPFAQVKKHSLLFIGHLLEKQGVQEVLNAIPLIVKKINDFEFVIVGKGGYEPVLKDLIKSLKIEKYVKFMGPLPYQTLYSFMSSYACGAATYKPEVGQENFSYYADSGKIRDYISAGLPTIATDVTYIARELEKKNCVVVVNYSKEGIARTVVDLMNNETRLEKMRISALKEARQYDWDKIFTQALAK